MCHFVVWVCGNVPKGTRRVDAEAAGGRVPQSHHVTTHGASPLWPTTAMSMGADREAAAGDQCLGAGAGINPDSPRHSVRDNDVAVRSNSERSQGDQRGVLQGLSWVRMLCAPVIRSILGIGYL